MVDYKKNPKTAFDEIDDMSKKEVREQIEDLREAIDFHDHKYYVENDPVISDATYDKLFERLQELEEAYPEFESDLSPTKRVGGKPQDELGTVEHRSDMLSLNAVLEEEGVERFDGNVKEKGKSDYMLEPKFDGFSVEIVYREGSFDHGATRGDGRKGEDISENIKTIGAVQLRLRGEDHPEILSVRGEVFIPRKAFQELNKGRVENNEDPFANPRNAAAGLMRQLDPKKVADKPFDVVFYEILDAGEMNEISSQHEVLERLGQWGLKTDPHNTRVSSLKEIRSYRDDLLSERDELDYEIDGIVIKVDDHDMQQELGTRERSPRWALAWKFPPRKEVTELDDIVVQVGRTGILTPVALLRPVDVGGVTVSRATLHNADEVERKDIRPGDRVRIERAGDVIPEVVERIKQPGKKRGSEFSMPDRCPSCGERVVREGAYHLCPAGLSCRAQLEGRIIHYAEREAMDIDGLGGKTAEALVEQGLVESIVDLYDLDVKDLEELPGFAEKSAKDLREAIQDASRVRLDRFLYALGIRHTGRHIASVLARALGSLEKLEGADEKELREIDEIGPETARSVAQFFSSKNNRRIIDGLQAAGVEVADMPTREKKTLQGKTFVFTGELEDFTRDEAKRAVEELGGRATSSVSGNTDYLVKGDDPGSKLDDAQEEDVEIIGEKRFKKMLEGD